MTGGAGSHVVVVGGGFAGLNAAQRLAKLRDLRVTVIDRRNHHLFQPLLYQVAMAGLSPADIAVPIRSLLSRHPRVRVLRAEVSAVDLAARRISTDHGEHTYDHLLLACGADHAYFGHEEWEPFAPGLKTLEQATEIRRRVLEAFEEAEATADADHARACLTFVIVGGGPTGVELAGAIGEMSRFTLARDFRRIDPKQTRVILVEAGPRILPSFDEKLASRAMRDLEGMGVQVWTASAVTGIDGHGVSIGAERVRAATVLWAAGVRAAALAGSLGVELDKLGRVPVQPDLSLAGHPEAFVAGDMACAAGADGAPLPGIAPVAIQQGRHVAECIRRDLRGEPRQPFSYRDKGQAASIGRKRALLQTPHLRMAGLGAWLAWLVVHIYYLVGFRNRLLVVLQWAWSYLTFGRGARLIVEKEWRFYARRPPAAADQSRGRNSPSTLE